MSYYMNWCCGAQEFKRFQHFPHSEISRLISLSESDASAVVSTMKCGEEGRGVGKGGTST